MTMRDAKDQNSERKWGRGLGKKKSPSRGKERRKNKTQVNEKRWGYPFQGSSGTGGSTDIKRKTAEKGKSESSAKKLDCGLGNRDPGREWIKRSRQFQPEVSPKKTAVAE